MKQQKTRRPDIVILTAIPVEYQAVRTHLIELQEELHPQGTIYECGVFVSDQRTWNVAIVEAGAGNTGIATEAERPINHFQAKMVFLVGVAGGLKDVRLGDVVAATKVYGYESGKETDAAFLTRPNVGNAAYRLEQRAKAEARRPDWRKRIQGETSTPPPEIYVAPIAAGEKVIASTRSATWKFVRNHYNDAIAIEMEGYGFLQAVHANPHVEALVIRGISDLIDKKSEADANNSQQIAAHNASAFAFELLAKWVE